MSITRTVVIIDLVGYSSIAELLEQSSDVDAVAKLNQQIQDFVDKGLVAARVPREQAVVTTTGALEFQDEVAATHYVGRHKRGGAVRTSRLDRTPLTIQYRRHRSPPLHARLWALAPSLLPKAKGRAGEGAAPALGKREWEASRRKPVELRAPTCDGGSSSEARVLEGATSAADNNRPQHTPHRRSLARLSNLLRDAFVPMPCPGGYVRQRAGRRLACLRVSRRTATQ